MARLLSSSTLVPQNYQGDKNLPNVIVAMEIANRMGGMSIFQVMQNLNVIHGKPSWSSQFIIGMINGCGRFTSLQFKTQGEGTSLKCYAIAEEKSTGRELKGPVVSWKMAVDEGWATKGGSKWKTMPELMIRYRAAAFWGRLYVPEMLLGIYSSDEVIDIAAVDSQPVAEEKKYAARINDQVRQKTAQVESQNATPSSGVVVQENETESDPFNEED